MATLLLALGLLLPQAGAQPSVMPLPGGVWQAWLDSPGGELPFRLSFESEDAACIAALVDGTRRLVASRTVLAGDTIEIAWDDLDSVVRATIGPGGTALDGTFEHQRDPTQRTKLAFHARFEDLGAEPPPLPIAPPSDPGRGPGFRPCTGRFALRFSDVAQPAIALLAEDHAGAIQGTVLTVAGDWRSLAGRRQGTDVVLWGFDGARAVVLRAALTGKGLEQGRFWLGDGEPIAFAAARDDSVVLPDRFAQTRRTGQIIDVALPDLDGQQRRLADPALRGRACILFVFGPWSPSCHDATQALLALHERYGEQGLKVVGLACALTGDAERSRRALRAYAARHDVPWPLLSAGTVDGTAGRALAFLGDIVAYPTVAFVRGDGTIDGICTGFVGPAAPREHQALVTSWAARIEALLAN